MKGFFGGIGISNADHEMATNHVPGIVQKSFSRLQQMVFTQLNDLSVPEAITRPSVVYDTLDQMAVLRFSMLKNGSGAVTRQFGEDMAVQIRNIFGDQIANDQGAWGIVSIGSSKFLGETVAQKLGLSKSHLRVDELSFLKIRNYAVVSTTEERVRILNSKIITLEHRRRFKAKNVILVDDLLNRGVTLERAVNVLTGQYGLNVAGMHVLFSIANVEDPSLETHMNSAFIEKGVSSLIQMVNQEEIFVTRHLLMVLFYGKDRLQNLVALNPRKRLVVLSRGFAYLTAKVWGVAKARCILTANKVSSRILDFVVKLMRRSRLIWDDLTVDFMKSDLRSVNSAIERMVTEGNTAAFVVPVAQHGSQAGLPFDAARPFRAVLLDLDGTLKSAWQLKPSGRVLDRIVALLENGYKVGIASGRDENGIRKLIIDNVLHRIIDHRLMQSLYIFEQDGSLGFRVFDGKVLIPRQSMNDQDRLRILDQLRGVLRPTACWFGSLVSVTPAIISIEIASRTERLNLIHHLIQNMSDWELVEKYAVYDTGVNIHIVPARVNKGVVADVFAAELALSQEEILKVGNMHGIVGNDYPMLAKPGGVGVDSPDATVWLMDLVLRQNAVSHRS